MVSLRCAAALALAFLFMAPPVYADAGTAGEPEGGAGPRTEWVQQNPSEIEMKPNGTAYSNAAFRVPVPANATASATRPGVIPPSPSTMCTRGASGPK